MANKIHHNTAKKAKAHGITLEVVDGEIVASWNGKRLASGLSGSVVLDKAIELANGQLPGPALLDETLNAPFRKSKPKTKVEDDDEEDEEEGADEEADDVEDDEEAEAEEGKSVVKRKYKTRYRPFKMTCGDDLARLVSEHIQVEGEDGELRVDHKKLYRFAVANACWVSSYKDLNIGMQRMNVVNRLRARVRHGHEIKWA